MKFGLNRKLSLQASALIILSAVLVVAAVEVRALRAKEPALNPDKKLNAAECVRCHADQKTIRTMRMKEDGGNYLFNSDGTFKDPKLASLNGNYHHTGVSGGAPTK